MGLREMDSALPPGFRFYPSDEELVSFYLRKKVANERVASGTLVEVDLHAREPWELPDVAKLTAEEWYFFSFRDRKYATGSRTNRATKTGYWKATGKDRMVHEPGTRTLVGMRKTLVFYLGRAPNGQKTSWVMHEFRLETPNAPPKEDWVLCRVFNKQKPSETEQSNSALHHNNAATLLCSPPDTATAGKFYDQRQEATAAVSYCGSSGASLMDLPMLNQGSFLDYYCSAVGHGDVAIGPHITGCGGDAMAMGPGHAMAFEEQGMGEIETEYSSQALLLGGSCFKDGLYF
ncbi:hypothetical protein EJB05_22003 [Eragrostis curvula]|uniref:NAC domain-containing protein n=1 Tax=Eragrostis curvula TaxID=38414 RepID=A0A5J9V4P4_9POAL|nr:hypothetical protein EJB05_22003 [Eragrostis curvula]